MRAVGLIVVVVLATCVALTHEQHAQARRVAAEREVAEPCPGMPTDSAGDPGDARLQVASEGP